MITSTKDTTNNIVDMAFTSGDTPTRTIEYTLSGNIS